MNQTNNIFSYAPKELTTDAFLAWLFIELDTNEELKQFQIEVFKALKVCTECTAISNVEVELQSDRIDLLLNFKEDGKDVTVLFENKTWTSFHDDQLERYKGTKSGNKATRFIYLKLAYVHSEEHKAVRSADYKIVGSEELFKVLIPIAGRHFLIGQYCEYLESNFLQPRREIQNAIKAGKDNTIFRHGGAQKIFLDTIRAELEGLLPMYLKAGVNQDGTPWTELEFCKSEKQYSQVNETVFLRLDKRSGKYYARLNQYAYIGDEQWEEKERRLQLLRSIASPLATELGLNAGKLQNSGRKESEIIIFFLEENGLLLLREKLPKLMQRFAEKYSSISKQAVD